MTSAGLPGADIAFESGEVGPAWRGFWDALEFAAFPALSAFDASTNTGHSVALTQKGPAIFTRNRSLAVVDAPGGRAWEGIYQPAVNGSWRATTLAPVTSSTPMFSGMWTNPEASMMLVMQKIGTTFTGGGLGSLISQAATANAGDFRWRENGTTNRIQLSIADGAAFPVYLSPTLSEAEVRDAPRAYIGMMRQRRARMFWRNYGSVVDTTDRNRGGGNAPGQLDSLGIGSVTTNAGFSAGSTDWWHYLTCLWNRPLTDHEAWQLADDPWGPFRRTRSVVAFASAALPTTTIRPSADITDGGWLNEGGNNTNLYASVDDDPTNDSTWIESPLSASPEMVELLLADPGGVPPSGEMTLTLRIQRV